MKTIEEAAKDFNDSHVNGHHPQKWVSDIFKAGAEFAQRWISVDEVLPEIGEKVITKMTKDKRTSYGIATIIREEWEINSHWIDHTFSNMTITHWRPIELK